MNFHEILGTGVPRDKEQLIGDGGDLCPDFLTENKKVWKLSMLISPKFGGKDAIVEDGH